MIRKIFTYHQNKPLINNWESFLNLYQTSFPPSQRIPMTDFAKLVAEGQRTLYLMKELQQVVGFGLIRPLQEINFLFLEYLAIAPAFQNKNRGSLLYQKIRTDFRKTRQYEGILLEIEPPATAETPEESYWRKKRFAFYQKNQTYLLADFDKYQMYDLGGSGQKIPMLLLCSPLTKNKINSPHDVKQIIQTIHKEIYQV